ncbi:hypothetical protein ACHAWF_013826, partial [Thalassiosira exigua]
GQGQLRRAQVQQGQGPPLGQLEPEPAQWPAQEQARIQMPGELAPGADDAGLTAPLPVPPLPPLPPEQQYPHPTMQQSPYSQPPQPQPQYPTPLQPNGPQLQRHQQGQQQLQPLQPLRPPTTAAAADDVEEEAPELPFLERALGRELRLRVASDASSPTRDGDDDDDGGRPAKTARTRPKEAPFRSLGFDVLFSRLADFQAEHGHASPPVKHPELGRWVSELRLGKKALRERGLEWEPDEEEEEEVGAEEAAGGEGTGLVVAAGAGEAEGTPATRDAAAGETEATDGATERAANEGEEGGIEAEAPPEAVEGAEGGVQAEAAAAVDAAKAEGSDAPPSAPSPPADNTRLTRRRVEALDSLDFPWSVMPARMSFDERLADLRAFRERHGRFPTNKEGGLGNWLKQQRKLYTKRDGEFMEKKFPRVSVGMRRCARGDVFSVVRHGSWCCDSSCQSLVEVMFGAGQVSQPGAFFTCRV